MHRLKRDAAQKPPKGPTSQPQPDKAQGSSKPDHFLEILKQKFGADGSTEGTRPKRKRMSPTPLGTDCSTSSAMLDLSSDLDHNQIGSRPSIQTPPLLHLLSCGISDCDSLGIRLEPLDLSSRINLPRVWLVMPKWVTSTNRFGLYQQYPAAPGPSLIPDETASHNNFVLPKPGSSPTVQVSSKAEVDKALLEAVHPFPNLTSFWFRKHHLDNANNSQAVAAKLQELLLHPRFKSADLNDYNMEKIDHIIINGTPIRTREPPNVSKTGEWTETAVKINVPLSTKESPLSALPVQIPGLHYRKLTTVIKTSLSNPAIMKKIHLKPYHSIWTRPGTSTTERVFDEVYTSDAMLKAHSDLQRQAREPGCDLERVVLALLFASDATHSTNFGQAKLWPLYMAFGNISKYDRCKPGLSLMEHVAYFPSIPDKIRDEIRAKLGKAAAKPVITHCHHELMHTIWRIILDDDFVEAWRHGIVLTCADGIQRRFYPRIFTYSADYPEKYVELCS
ncbi:hypothetical protein FS837_004730 [Tulasnella sp. UAMH 9824]|nr:hypothetical protein FS837_004730 [Tulasnella sp. UAMH 9824]